MKRIIMLSTFMGLLSFSGCAIQTKVDNAPITTDFSLNRYLGQWNEIARFDHRFERGIQQSTAQYSLRPDGKVAVLNSGIKDGKTKEAKGKAFRSWEICCRR